MEKPPSPDFLYEISIRIQFYCRIHPNRTAYTFWITNPTVDRYCAIPF